jgi:hypothetical protein
MTPAGLRRAGHDRRLTSRSDSRAPPDHGGSTSTVAGRRRRSSHPARSCDARFVVDATQGGAAVRWAPLRSRGAGGLAAHKRAAQASFVAARRARMLSTREGGAGATPAASITGPCEGSRYRWRLRPGGCTVTFTTGVRIVKKGWRTFVRTVPAIGLYVSLYQDIKRGTRMTIATPTKVLVSRMSSITGRSRDCPR